jgi:CRP/FNR family cyclic AMP-dependent transcriptional regulator
MNHSFPGNSRKEGSVLSAIIDMMHRMFLFADLNEHELEQIAEAALVRSYRSKSNVFMEGEVRQAVYFINKGVIKVYKVDHHGNEAIMNFLKPGDMFPHAGFFENEPYPGTAEVVLEAELGVVPVKAFENILLSRPEIAIKVMRVMGRKIRELQAKVRDLSSIDINFRIAALLVRLAREYGVQGSYGTLIELRTIWIWPEWRARLGKRLIVLSIDSREKVCCRTCQDSLSLRICQAWSDTLNSCRTNNCDM